MADLDKLEEQFYEFTSCELPEDADPTLSLHTHLLSWFNQQISSVEESIILIKKRMIHANDDLIAVLKEKLNSLTHELNSLNRRKIASKILYKND
jgi:hypothetical protein